MDYTLLHLKGNRCSRRAVRVIELLPDEKDDLMLQAAKAVGQDASIIELKKREWKMGVLSMIKQVSTEPVTGDPNGPDVKWKSYDYQTIETDYSKLFTSKDHALLVAAFRSFHEVTDDEVAAIVGKALPVSAD